MKKFYGFILLTIFIFFCSCGEKEEGFDFSLLNQFHYETDSVNITITGIKDDEVEEIIIPEGVTIISEISFFACHNLKRVYIPSTVGYINPKCYWKCELLEEFVIDENNEQYMSIDGNIYSKDGTKFIRYMMGKKEETVTITGVKEIGDYAFWCVDDVKNVIIDEGVEILGDYSFGISDSIESIKLPKSLVKIGEHSFVATNIKEINIFENVSEIGIGTFSNCEYLENINVSKDNPYYCDVDGVLFNKNVTELYAYTFGKKADLYRVPDTVKEVIDHAFSLVGFFDSSFDVILPKGINKIGETTYDSYNGYCYLEFYYLGDYKDMYYANIKSNEIFIFCYSETEILCWSFDENGKPKINYGEEE